MKERGRNFNYNIKCIHRPLNCPYFTYSLLVINKENKELLHSEKIKLKANTQEKNRILMKL